MDFFLLSRHSYIITLALLFGHTYIYLRLSSRTWVFHILSSWNHYYYSSGSLKDLL